MSRNSMPFDDALEAVLSASRVPALSEGFADRVVAASASRAAALPRSRFVPWRHWRGQRWAVGVVAAGALATGAAATGLIDKLPIDIPSVEDVWEAITDPTAETTPARLTGPASEEQAVSARVEIEGAIDTPEELEEVFRRYDELRTSVRDTRRAVNDRRIDNTIERRRAIGLSAPNADQEERFRERLERYRGRTDARIEGQLEDRRNNLRDDVEDGASLSREQLIRRQLGIESDTPIADRLERFRNLPADERRARIREWREQRQQRRQDWQAAGQDLADSEREIADELVDNELNSEPTFDIEPPVLGQEEAGTSSFARPDLSISRPITINPDADATTPDRTVTPLNTGNTATERRDQSSDLDGVRAQDVQDNRSVSQRVTSSTRETILSRERRPTVSNGQGTRIGSQTRTRSGSQSRSRGVRPRRAQPR